MNERLERIEGLLLERRQASDEGIDDPTIQNPIRLVEITELLGVTSSVLWSIRGSGHGPVATSKA
jgi:hypothetical protein